MARLPWKPGEREKAESLFNSTGSVVVRKNPDGFMETDQKGEDRKSYLEILAHAKENEKEEVAKKESPVLIATRNTPNEEITEIIKPRTVRKKLPGYTEKVMPDGSIISSEQWKAKGAKPGKQTRLKEDRGPR